MTTIESETEVSYVLTADDIKAIKRAIEGYGYACFFYRPNGSEGVSWGMRVGFDVELNDAAPRKLLQVSRDGFWHRSWIDEHKASYIHVIAADPAKCNIIRYEGWRDRDVVEAVCLVWPSRNHVSHALSTLKAGDRIGLHFQANNQTEALNGVSFVRDEMNLRVFRGDKQTAEFLMDFYVGPDNTARFVR